MVIDKDILLSEILQKVASRHIQIAIITLKTSKMKKYSNILIAV